MTAWRTRQLGVKVYCESEEARPHEALVRAFHRFIQEEAVAHEMPIDVARYPHLTEGPAVMLICHEAHYAFDHRKNQAGIYFARKHRATTRPFLDPQHSVKDAFYRAFWMANALASAEELKDELRFNPARLAFFIHDRLHAPNTEATRDEVIYIVQEVLGQTLDAEVECAPAEDPREPFWLDLSLGKVELDLSEAAARFRA